MALVLSALQTPLKGFVASPPKSVADASQKWAQAYFTYALAAMALDATPAVALNLKTYQPLAATFLAAMQAQTFLDQLPGNLTTFWVGTNFIGANQGLAVSAAGTPALVTAITALKLANQQNRGASALDDLAAAIHTWTMTVIVNLVNPASGVVIPTPLL